jgi:PKD repeat protein
MAGSVPVALYGASLLGSHSLNPKTPAPLKQPPFNGVARLGIDCGYGSNQAVANSTGYPGADGTDATGNALNPTLDSSCTWAGAPDGNGQLQPLVSDNPTLNPGPSCCAAPSKGGGFTAELVFIQNSTYVINGFDVSLSWDPKILNAIEFDQGGLPWFGGNSFTVTNSIDNTMGAAELSQALLSPPAPTATLMSNQTLFRVRFDVVGIGNTNLDIFNDYILDANLPTSPPNLRHITVQGSFASSNIPDSIASATLGYRVTWLFTPNPEVPGSTLTLVATASCTSCTGPLSYRWDTDSIQAYPANTTAATVEATGRSVSIIAPTATLLAHRVTLIVADSSGHIAEATRQLPLAITPPPSQTIGINTPASLTAEWLGGIPPYSGTTGQVGVKWILCNSTGISQTICTNPNPSLSNTPAQLITVSNTYKWAGVFTGSVTVTDTQEVQLPGPNSVSARFPVNVTGTPQAYTVSVVSNATSGATTAQVVSFNATAAYAATYASAARSFTFSYTFKFGDGQTGLFTGGTIGKATHKYAAAGTYNVVVIAQETGANALAKIQETSFATFAVYVPLTGTQGVTAGPPMSGSFIFTGTGSGGQAPYTYSWDFGDGTTGTGSSVTHTYSASGTYVVTVTITDSGGRTFTSTQTVVASVSPTSNLFYAELGGGIAAAGAAIAALMIVRRRRKAANSTETGSTPAA